MSLQGHPVLLFGDVVFVRLASAPTIEYGGYVVFTDAATCLLGMPAAFWEAVDSRYTCSPRASLLHYNQGRGSISKYPSLSVDAGEHIAFLALRNLLEHVTWVSHHERCTHLVQGMHTCCPAGWTTLAFLHPNVYNIHVKASLQHQTNCD